MSHSRRKFLQGLGATALGAGSFATLSSALGGFQQAQAADVSGYKALVCIFLFGGMDSHDMLIPFDPASYDSYADIRQTLLAQYKSGDPALSRERDKLLPIAPVNGDGFGGRQFALAPELRNLHSMFEAGNAAIIGNVGPLVKPISRSGWQSRSVATPARLFSHNDQVASWMANKPEGAKYGWGGRFCDAAKASGGNAVPEFTSLSTMTNQLFSTGEQTNPYQISTAGRTEIRMAMEFSDTDAEQAIIDHFRAVGYQTDNLIQQDLINIAEDSMDLNAMFNDAREALVPLATQFPDNQLGQQLKAVAETVAIRNTLLNSRQVFLVAMDGFDTHSGQAFKLPRLMRELDAGIAAFYSALEEVGAARDVVTFTASDFGRTLAVNGDGTDHGWGSHHFVVGGAVEGRTIYGDVPPPEFDHEQDAGHGRLIPTTSVEEFAEPLGRWFGLGTAELEGVLPNLANFRNNTSSQALKSLLVS
ncbi:MAG: DUF1501 domain-containing protein [Henriciella sp.]|uniref:DUF1501 domain-containing protein n=1 Tax=Henriciella sp. TaxID=1968823 RepID=UPI003C75B322